MAEPMFDAIVVGAGAAGLAAAELLCREGARVALLEGRRRLGGRVHTLGRPGWPTPVELGGEFVHGRDPALFEILERADLPAYRLPDVHVRLSGKRFRLLSRPWDRYEAVTRRMRKKGRDRSVGEFLRAHRRSLNASTRRMFASFVEGYDAAWLDEISEHSLSTAGDPPLSDEDRAQFRIAEGFAAALSSIASRIDSARLRLFRSSAVRGIEWRPGRVRARAEDGRVFEGRRVLVTASVGVLKAGPKQRGSIRFDPDPLPLRRALSGLSMGEVAKLVLRFHRPFWRDFGRLAHWRAPRGTAAADPSLLHLPGAPFPTWWTAAPVETPILTAWAGGPAARAALALPDREMLRLALRTLGEALGISFTRLLRLLADWAFHDWSADPYSRGAYAYAVVGGAGAADLLAQPIARTLFFAGEAAAGGLEGGTVPAAIASGRRAARRMLR